MKRLLAVILGLAWGIACAQPLGFVISGAQLFTSNKVPVYYAKVQSTGPDFNSARQNAFKLAVEQAVGTVVLSETEMRNSRIVRDEIINYSSGFVDKYNILEQEQVNGSVKLVVEVWVASSAISNRLLNTSTAAGEVNGDRIAVQLSSLRDQRQQTDKLIDTVMKDFPKRAFDIVLQPVKVQFDSSRQGRLYVPFMMRWNPTYLDSIEEMLKTVNQYPQCKIMSGACNGAESSIVLNVNVFASNPGAWFNDMAPMDIMAKHIGRPAYRLILTHANRSQTVYCYRTGDFGRLAYFYGRRVSINGNEIIRTTLEVDLNNISVESIVSANVDIVREGQCQSTN